MTRRRQSTREQRVAFGIALKEAAEAAGLGASTTLSKYLIENGVQAGQATVSEWFRGAGGEPSRLQVLEIEQLLDLPAGTLSSRLGWVPVGSEIDDIEAAILSSPDLSPAHADALIVMLRTFRKQ